MLNVVRTIRRYLNKSLYKDESSFLNDCKCWVGDKLGSFIGAYERAIEVLLFIPVIFKCYRWDYSSMFIIIQHWLKRMEDVHRDDELHVNALRHAEEIRTCVLLLDRLIKHEYEDNSLSEHDKQWGEIESWSTPCQDSEYWTWHASRSNVVFEKDKKLERKQFLKAYEHSLYLEKQDITMLFNNIKKYYRGWWS